jgi:1-acyl-sn-glycerol-3-phosphate acyltransferase
LSTTRAFPVWQSAVLSALFWLVLVGFCALFNALGFILFLPLALVTGDRSRKMLHEVAVLWAKYVFFFSPFWKLRIKGRPLINPSKPYVFIANHQSLLDILVALGGIPNHFKFIAKKELFSLPFLGWHMGLAGYIPLERSSGESGKKTIYKARQWLRQGVSVLFFPEGTRSPDGQIREFKPGAFKIAQEFGIEVVPVVIDGTADAIPKKSWMIHKKSKFVISFGRPVLIPKDGGSDALRKARGAIREEMIERLEHIRRHRR